MKNSKLFKSSMQSGLIFGLIIIAIGIIMYITDFKPVGIGKGLMVFVITIAIYYLFLHFFTKQYRDKLNGGKIRYSEAFLFGLLLIFWAALISSVYTYIFNAYIDTDYAKNTFESVKEWTYNYMQQKGVPQDAIDKAMDKMDQQGVPSAFKSAWTGFLFSFIMGTIIALISAAVVKTKEDVFKEE